MWSPVSAAERLTSELLAAGLGGASSYRAWGRGGKLRYGTVNTRMHARHKRETKRALHDGIHEHALPLPRKARGATCFVAAQAPSLGADTPCLHGNPRERGLLLFMRSILFDAPAKHEELKEESQGLTEPLPEKPSSVHSFNPCAPVFNPGAQMHYFDIDWRVPASPDLDLYWLAILGTLAAARLRSKSKVSPPSSAGIFPLVRGEKYSESQALRGLSDL